MNENTHTERRTVDEELVGSGDCTKAYCHCDHHLCSWCGEPAKGYASAFGGMRFCHEGQSPTCYEQVQFDYWAERNLL